MVAVQRHRGPDDEGIYIDSENGIALGHNRLSIIDLSTAGHQPMQNSAGNLYLVFNGEIYNHRELRQELSSYAFSSRTDSEVILAAYEKWGPDCVKKFIGMFAFAIWDADKQLLFCARDRLGIKPFHWHHDPSHFLFGSEIKALIAGGVVPRPDWQSWSHYLHDGFYDHGDRTFFATVNSLAPGHFMIVQNGTITESCYWRLEDHCDVSSDIGVDEAAERFHTLLTDSVNLRLRSDVPVGVNLSGGLDSAGLFSVVDRLREKSNPLHAFTAAYGDKRYDEDSYADDVTSFSEIHQTVNQLTSKAMQQELDTAIWHQEAPIGGVATVGYHALHKTIRDNGIKVSMEGQGVDEILAGYAYFKPPFYSDLLEQGKCMTLRQELRSANQVDSDLRAIRDYRDGSKSQKYQDGTDFLASECISESLSAARFPKPNFHQPFEDSLTNALYRDLRHTKLPRVLRMNDRLSMAFGVELREPYLDHRLVEFAFGLPSTMKIHQGVSKYLLRRAMKNDLPENIVSAPKRAVVTPQREWLRQELRAFVLNLINSKSFASRNIFDPVAVKSRFEDFCRGIGDNSFFVWQWVNTELWFRQFCPDSAFPSKLES
jgi:asparagine synthase (glutamine-hydrolysing)